GSRDPSSIYHINWDSSKTEGFHPGPGTPSRGHRQSGGAFPKMVSLAALFFRDRQALHWAPGGGSVPGPSSLRSAFLQAVAQAGDVLDVVHFAEHDPQDTHKLLALGAIALGLG